MFDPFEVLGLNKKFELDLKVLNKHYFDTLKSAHPDRFIGVDEERKNQISLKAGEANKAYGILKNPVHRGLYLLKDAGEKPLDHDPVYLSEVMSWNERIEAGEDLREELTEEGELLLQSLQSGFDTQDYRKVKVNLYRLTYVRNLLSTLEEKK